MSGILTARIQFEIKYTHVLNFSNIYREIVSPYLKLSSGFKLQHQNTPQEYIQLIFDEDNFHVDCRWDRIIFVSEGSLSKFKDSKSSFKIFFEIFEQIRKQPSFGKVNNYVALVHGIKLYDNKTSQDLVENFQKKFLNDNTFKICAGNDVKDLAVVLDFNELNKEVDITFGPFDPERDIQTRNLHPFKSQELNKISEDLGYIMELKLNDVTQEINFSKFKTFIELVEKYYSKFDQLL